MRLPKGAGLGVLVACSVLAVGTSGIAEEDEYLVFESEHLSHGRSVWLGTCENCHGIGVGGAPEPTEPPAWDARLEKPRETLYAHALEGFFGPRGTMMPPRGGNENLTDDEVRAAVDYMVALAAEHSRKAKGESK